MIMMRSFIAFVLCILLLPTIALSQDKESRQKETNETPENKKKKKQELVPDSNFVVSYPELITLGLFTASPIMRLTIDPVNEGLDKYKSQFQGNFSDLVGFMFSYQKLSLQFGFKTPFGPPADAKKGRTISTGLTLKIKKPNISGTAEYRSYAGYYDNNSPNYVPQVDSLVVRRDIRYKNIGANGIYNFSWRKYSYNAPLTFHDRQLKPRLGFLVKGGLNYITISSSDSSLLSSVQTAQFTSFDDVRAVNSLLLKIGPGVGANIVFFKRLYISLNYFLMGNFIAYTYDVIDEKRSPWSTNANLYTESAIGFGYNAKRVFAGVSFNGDINIMKIRDARIQTNFATVLITAGYRFNAPTFMTKLWKKTQELKE